MGTHHISVDNPYRLPGQRVWISVNATDVLNVHIFQDMCHEHDQHKGMLGRQSSGAGWEDGKSVAGVVGVIHVEIGFRKES